MAALNMGAPANNVLRVEPFKGMDTASSPTQLDNNHSPDMRNVHIDSKGALQKRNGYDRTLTYSLGEGPIKGLYHYKNQFLFAHAGHLYESLDVPPSWEMDDLTITWESEV